MSFTNEICGPKSLIMSEFSNEDRQLQNVERWKGRTITMAKNEYCASCAGMWCIASIVTSVCLVICIPAFLTSSSSMGFSMFFGMLSSFSAGSLIPLTWGNENDFKERGKCCLIDRHYSRATLNMAKSNSRKRITQKILDLSLPSQTLKKYAKYGFLSEETYEKYCLLVHQRDLLNEKTKSVQEWILENERKVKVTYNANHTNFELFINEFPVENQAQFIKTSEYQEYATIKEQLEITQFALEKENKSLNNEINILLIQLRKELPSIDCFNEDLDLSCTSLFCKSYPNSSSVTFSECCSYCCSDEYIRFFKINSSHQ